MSIVFNSMEYSTYHEAISWELRAAVRRYYDEWEALLCSQAAAAPVHVVPLEQKRLCVVVLSACLIESVANFFICTQVDAPRFKKLDRESLHDKWAEVPKEFIPGYCLPTDVENDLTELIERRVAIVHAKPTISIDGDNRHNGNHPDLKLDEHQFLRRCATLPWRLIDNLCKGDYRIALCLGDLRQQCGAVDNVVSGGEARSSSYKDLPEELVTEIMSQGHRREVAVWCAAQIRHGADYDATGNIIVRRERERLPDRLKPLRYFEART